MLRTLRPITGGLALAALLTTVSMTTAEEAEGVVRLTPPVADGSVQPAGHSDCPTCQTEASVLPPSEGYDMGYCPGGNCPDGNCRSGYCPGGCPTGRCPGYGMDPLGNKLRCMTGIFGGSTHAPGEGYVTPSRRPMWDLSLPTSTMWSGQWTCGRGGAHPSTRRAVFMPTDTTQLGYSYSHVPYWMPRAGMTPPLPSPSDFHVRTCFDRCGRCKSAQSGFAVENGLPVTTPAPQPAAVAGGGTDGVDITQTVSQPILPTN